MLGHFWWDARRRFVLAAADAEVIVHPGFPTAPVSLELFILFAFGWLQHTWLHWKCCWYADKVQKWAHSAMGLVGDACRWWQMIPVHVTQPGRASLCLVRFPNPLATGSDIHGSWGPWLPSASLLATNMVPKAVDQAGKTWQADLIPKNPQSAYLRFLWQKCRKFCFLRQKGCF